MAKQQVIVDKKAKPINNHPPGVNTLKYAPKLRLLRVPPVYDGFTANNTFLENIIPVIYEVISSRSARLTIPAATTSISPLWRSPSIPPHDPFSSLERYILSEGKTYSRVKLNTLVTASVNSGMKPTYVVSPSLRDN